MITLSRNVISGPAMQFTCVGSSARRIVHSLACDACDSGVVPDGISREALAEFHRWETRQPYKLAVQRRRAACRSKRVGVWAKEAWPI